MSSQSVDTDYVIRYTRTVKLWRDTCLTLDTHSMYLDMGNVITTYRANRLVTCQRAQLSRLMTRGIQVQHMYPCARAGKPYRGNCARTFVDMRSQHTFFEWIDFEHLVGQPA